MATIEFIHAVDPDDVMAVHNLCFIKRLISAEYLPHSRSIREISLEELANNSIELGAISPRTSWTILAAAIIRRGGHISRGVHPYPSIPASPKAEARWLRMGDMELAFEKGRRALKPDAPSRLSALYLAENTPDGHDALGRMLPARRILKVVLIQTVRLMRADPQWLGEWERTKDTKAIENYWKSVEHSAHEMWEYLLDGSVGLHPSEDTSELAAFVAATRAAWQAENEQNRQP